MPLFSSSPILELPLLSLLTETTCASCGLS